MIVRLSMLVTAVQASYAAMSILPSGPYDGSFDGENDIVSKSITAVGSTLKIKPFTAGAPTQFVNSNTSEAVNIPFNILHHFYSTDPNQVTASQTAHKLFDFSAASMDQQQLEQINNLASIGFFNVQQQQLPQEGSNYFDENPESEVISSTETACTAGGKWLFNANTQAADYYNACRLELGLAGEEMFCKRSMDFCTATEDRLLHALGSNIHNNTPEGNNINYVGLISTQSSNASDYCSSGNGASANIAPLNFVHGAQSSARTQGFDNIAAASGIPSMALADHYWGHGETKADPNIMNSPAGCSWNQQDAPSTSPARRSSLIINNQGSHSSYDQKEGHSLLNYLRDTAADEQMRQNERISPFDCSYSQTGYGTASSLRSSKYLRAAQRLLEEVCNTKSCYDRMKRACTESNGVEQMEASKCRKQQRMSTEDRCRLQMKQARLIGMLEKLDQTYQKYQDQMQLIVTSFESATGLMGATAPYTALVKKLISRQFRTLRDAIGEHIHGACTMLGEEISSVPILNKGETPSLRILDQRLRHHRTLQQVSMLSQHHQGWRPQRGLPERSVAVLRAWLFEHFLFPYPKDAEKLMLARLTGLTRRQVANWFINARVRLWKPMVEQLYADERKEAESQNQAEAERYEDISITEYGSNGGSEGNDVMALAIHENPLKHHYHHQHLVHEECDMSRASHSSIDKHGVSLTLALDHSSAVALAPNTYKPNQHYLLHPISGAADYNIMGTFR